MFLTRLRFFHDSPCILSGSNVSGTISLKGDLLKMHRSYITIACRKIWRFKQNSVRFSLGRGLMHFKESGPVPTNDSYLISISAYTIKLASKLKLRYNTFV